MFAVFCHFSPERFSRFIFYSQKHKSSKLKWRPNFQRPSITVHGRQLIWLVVASKAKQTHQIRKRSETIGNWEMVKMWEKWLRHRGAPNLGMNLGIFLMGIWYLIGRFPSWEMTKCNWRFWGNNWQEAGLTVKYFRQSWRKKWIRKNMMWDKIQKIQIPLLIVQRGAAKRQWRHKGVYQPELKRQQFCK